MCELFLRTNKTSIIKLNAHVLVTYEWLSVEHGSPFFPLCFLAFFNVFFWNKCCCSTCKFTDQVNDGFVDFIIDIIESAGSGEHGEEVVDALVPLILAFNQHFVGKDTGQKLCQTVYLCRLNNFWWKCVKVSPSWEKWNSCCSFNEGLKKSADKSSRTSRFSCWARNVSFRQVFYQQNKNESKLRLS